MNSTITEIFNSIPKDFFNLKIVHHGAVVNTIFECGYFNDRIIKLHEDITLIQVNDAYGSEKSKINKITFENPKQIVDIVVPTYEKWLSKPRELLNYITKNYDNLPEYILYTDATDVAILNDITSPKEMLEYYQCDVLFNCEPNYMHTGFGLPSHAYYNPLYENESQVYRSLNEQKYGIAHLRSINAGVFLGKKDYVVFMLKEAMKYMLDDHNKGFPYGCLDDQCMFRWLQNQHFNNISVDVYNNYFLFGYPKSIEVDEDDWEHFNFFKNNYEKIYIEKKTK
jgi:hypothetical protein